MGRDIRATARLITSGGNECQAVSQHRVGQRNPPHAIRYRVGREREEERRGRKERESEGSARCSAGTLFAPRDTAGGVLY